MFGQLVATSAKRDQIGQRISLLIVFILSLYITKSAKWSDVVNVEQSFAFLVFGLAALTSVTVTLAGFALLRRPIGAVVGNAAAFPRGIGRTNIVLREPLTFAGIIAKVARAGTHVIRRALQLLTAGGANNKTRLFCSAKKSPLIFGIAIFVTKVIVVLFNLARRTFEYFAALRARYIGALVIPVLFSDQRALVFAITLVIAKVIGTPQRMLGLTPNRFSALRAANFNSLVVLVSRANSDALCRRLAFSVTKLLGASFQSGGAALKFFSTVSAVDLDFCGTRHNKTPLTQSKTDSFEVGKARCQWPNFSKWFMRPSLSLLNYTTGAVAN